MDLISEVKAPYEAAIKECWEDMEKFYVKEDNRAKLVFPTTVASDTGLHMAVYSGTKEPLQKLLQLVGDDIVLLTNRYGNTILHEAAAIGNFGAVKLLVGRFRGSDKLIEFLEKKNNNNETPLFKAAAFGSTKSVLLLAKQGQAISDGKLKDVHRQRKDSQEKVESSILHVAIQGEHFGTALALVKLDESLQELRDKNGMDSLQLLATIPSAFRSGCRMGIWKRFLYFCMPVDDDYNDGSDDEDDGDDNEELLNCQPPSRDLESGIRKNRKPWYKSKVSIRKFFFKAWPTLSEIWKEKRKHKFALKLAKLLIEDDTSGTQLEDSKLFSEGRGSQSEGQYPKPNKAETTLLPESQSEGQCPKPKAEITLLLATKSGIKEIVDEIFKVHPQAIEHASHLNQTILHMAIMHRQKEIFKRVKKIKMPMTRLVQVIDIEGYTSLHHAADNKHVKGEGTRPGPAYQLQEELKWFRRVEKITPRHHARYKCKITEDTKEHGYMTPKELFDWKHKNQLEEAQKWIKDTSQSCSAVAVLVATVVFAAAYTVPGGNKENGFPVFLDTPFFVVFTVMDIVSLACSLTSVVMFLSILTSPFKYDDFLLSLPRKLTFGFTLLFFSVATTMLAFTATILLIIRLEPQRWTSTLVYSAAFLPVTILALTQFPMFIAFTETLMNMLKVIKRILPLNLCSRLRWPKRKDD